MRGPGVCISFTLSGFGHLRKNEAHPKINEDFQCLDYDFGFNVTNILCKYMSNQEIKKFELKE